MNKVQTMQNRLLKVLYNRPFRSPTNELHNELKLVKVKDIYHINILKFVYNSVNHISVKQFHNYFKMQNTRHMHNTRQHNHLHVNRSKTSYGENMILNKGAVLWNSLNHIIQNSKSLNVFKKALRNFYLSKYSEQ